MVDGRYRIGELARRTGVTPELLRAWERRYGLLDPERSTGGFRLYSDEDVARIAAMQGHLEHGIAAGEAARLALAEPSPKGTDGDGELLPALLRFDESAAHAAFDRLLAEYGREAVLRDAVLPALRAIGDGWERGDVTVAQEHFASTLLRGRLLGLARGWDRGNGSRALLAAPPGERHDLGLIVFGLGLREHGWRITVLGADTPVETLLDAVGAVRPQLVVLAALNAERFLDHADEIARVAEIVPVAIGGGGATHDVAARLGAATLLHDDPLAAAARVAAGPGR
jgi:DNA-binding transcriptional MerR regulator